MSRWLRTIWRNRECVSWNGISAEAGTVRSTLSGRNGEIDIVGRDGKYLVFVEVKYRSGDEKGNAAEAVTTAKQRTICRVADYYRYLHHYGEDTWVRYDVVAIQGEALHWIPNAFPHHYSARS